MERQKVSEREREIQRTKMRENGATNEGRQKENERKRVRDRE